MIEATPDFRVFLSWMALAFVIWLNGEWVGSHATRSRTLSGRPAAWDVGLPAGTDAVGLDLIQPGRCPSQGIESTARPINIRPTIELDVVRCKYAHSSAEAPDAGGLVPALSSRSRAPTGVGPVGYSTENATDTFVKFDLDSPAHLFEIGAFSGVVRAGDFSPDWTVIYAIDHSSSLFVLIDPSSGEKTNVGPAVPIAGHNWTGLAVDPMTGTVFASSCDLAASALYELDPLTGSASYIGMLPGAACNVALGMDGAGQLYGFDIVSDLLMKIDASTGSTIPIGPLGFDSNFSQGMDFDPATGLLYLAAFNNDTLRAELRTVDTITGSSQWVGNIGEMDPGGTANIGWLAIDKITVHLPVVIR